MIKITDKSKCCGCGACYNVCTSNAIAMQEDIEGFLYPVINAKFCIKCGLCLKVCPVIKVKDNRQTQNTVLEVYGAKNKNIEEQKLSSSGGMFSLLANYILDNNGVVFGAGYNEKWEVVHTCIDNKESLDILRRSKYVQSYIGNTLKKAKEFLDKDKYVLFVGTPCQIAGLKGFLNTDYNNLYCMDIFCHSVPSPKVWEMFLKQNFDIRDINSIDFRNKDFGWEKSYLKIVLNNKKMYPYLPFYMKLITLFVPKKYHIKLLIGLYSLSFRKGFLASLYSRPSCHNCCFKGKQKQSDITVGDLWGIFEIAPHMYDKNGVSVITVNSLKGRFLFEQIKNNLDFTIIDFDKMVKYNPYFLNSVGAHPKRQEFFDSYQTEPLNDLINRLLHKPFLKRCFNFLKNQLKK